MGKKDKKISELTAMGTVDLDDEFPIIRTITGPLRTRAAQFLGDLPKTPATKVVAASNTQNGEARADYVCNGAADEVQINVALAALPAGEGGKVVCLEGTYNIAAPISIPFPDRTEFCGVGPATIFVPSAAVNVIEIEPDPAFGGTGLTAQELLIHSFSIRSTQAGAHTGILVQNRHGAIIRDCFFWGNGTNQLTAIEINGMNNGIIANNFMNVPFRGIFSEGGLGDFDDVTIIGNNISYSRDDAIFLYGNSSKCSVIGNSIEECAGIGIVVYGANHTIVGNTITENRDEQSIALAVLTNSIIANNIIADTGVTAAGTVAAITMDQVTRCIIANNFIGDIYGSAYQLNGIRCTNALSFENIIEGNFIQGSDDNGIHFINTLRNVIRGNYILENAQSGIYLQDTSLNDVSGNYVYDNERHGIILSGADDNKVTDNYCYHNAQNGLTNTDNILLTNSDDNHVHGNTCRAGAGNQPRYGIYNAAGCDDNVIDNNDVKAGGATANMLEAGTNTTIRHNPGYVSENGGKSAAIATGGTIAHGCALTPTIIQVNAAEAGPTDITIAVGAANITVNFGGGGNRTFFWYARVSP